MSDSPDFVVVMRPLDAMAADIARLLENEIPVLVQSLQVLVRRGLMTAGEGAWGRLLVPRPDAERARRILEAYFGGEPAEEAPKP